MQGDELTMVRKIRMKSGHEFVLIVYTSCDSTGRAKPAGEDAIRVVLLFFHEGKVRWSSGTTRVHRIKTWDKNLMKRLENWRSMLPEKACPTCSAPMKKRESHTGNEFWGCATYPTCKGTRSV
jgi:restriction system protein